MYLFIHNAVIMVKRIFKTNQANNIHIKTLVIADAALE